MKILLCCAGGFSTNMIMQKMKKVIETSKVLDSKDFSFIAIPADLLENEIDNWEVILIGPQIEHKVDFVKSLADPRHIPYAVIDKELYGKVDGASILKLALLTHKKHQLAQAGR